jgi:DNA end-binding protein Ku
MSARAIWNGTLDIGKVCLPVKLYAAIEDEAVHFHLLHERDHERVKQRMVNPKSGEAREGGELHRGYEIEPGTFVLVTEEDVEALEPPASRAIELLRFVPAASIEPVWFERPYYLGPGAKNQDYFALAQVLRDRGRVGVARWVMRKRLYYGALQAKGDYLTLSSLHSVEEVVPAPKVEPMARPADARELAMAEQLVDALAGEFDPDAFADEHRRRVLELIDAKAKGKTIKPPPRVRQRAAQPLGVALEQSLRQMRRVPAERQKERRSA